MRVNPACTQTSPRNRPGSCCRANPTRLKATYAKSANSRRVVCGALALASNQEGLITQGRWSKSSPRNQAGLTGERLAADRATFQVPIPADLTSRSKAGVAENFTL